MGETRFPVDDWSVAGMVRQLLPLTEDDLYDLLARQDLAATQGASMGETSPKSITRRASRSSTSCARSSRPAPHWLRWRCVGSSCLMPSRPPSREQRRPSRPARMLPPRTLAPLPSAAMERIALLYEELVKPLVRQRGPSNQPSSRSSSATGSTAHPAHAVLRRRRTWPW